MDDVKEEEDEGPKENTPKKGPVVEVRVGQGLCIHGGAGASRDVLYRSNAHGNYDALSQTHTWDFRNMYAVLRMCDEWGANTSSLIVIYGS